MHDVHEVPKAASQAVQLPHDERIALPESLKSCRKPGAIILLPRCCVAVEVPLINAGGSERILLQVEYLGAVRLRNSHVAELDADVLRAQACAKIYNFIYVP